MNCSSPQGFPVHGILQGRIQEWIAIPFSRGSSWPKGKTQVSCIAGRFLTIWFTREPSVDKDTENMVSRGRSQDGGGLGRGDHFLSYKFIGRTIERWTNFTKQLLIASRGHQAPRKATHCLRREVGQNIKDKKGDKRARDGVPSWEGSLNRGSFQPPGNPYTGGSEGRFQISEGNLTGRKN